MTAISESFNVALSSGANTSYNLNGVLSYSGATTGKSLLILLPGATYNSSYWDPSVGTSFVQAAIGAGYATLNLDRLGTGVSGKPPGDQLTVDAESYALHQVVNQIRSGELATDRFSSITLVGHSYGSAVAIAEAATYQDVSKLVLTGFSHSANPTGFTNLGNDLVAATTDPANGQALPPGYFTTAAGARGSLFYDPSTSSQAIVANDEATKDVVAQGSFAGLSQVMNSMTFSTSVNVPVLGLIGADDAFFTNNGGNDFLANEPAYYSGSPSLTLDVVPATGHALQLSTTAPQADSLIINWLADQPNGPTEVPEPPSTAVLLPAILAFVLIGKRLRRRPGKTRAASCPVCPRAIAIGKGFEPWHPV